MKFKKIAAAVLAAAVLAATPATVKLFSPLGVTANAADALMEGDYSYTVNDDGETVTIDKYNGIDTVVDIPATLGGKTVTTIGGGHDSIFTYDQSQSITGVTIPDGVTNINAWAFGHCDLLTSITIPDSVTKIGSLAFQGCSLTSVTIPDSVTSLSADAFSFCSSLEGITVGENNERYSSINGVLFNKDKSELLFYPAGKKDKSYVIPDNVTYIYFDSSYNCAFLEGITVGENNANYSSIDGVLFNKDKSKLVYYPTGKKDKSYAIPNSVTTIYNNAFWGSKLLTEVTIPDSVMTIYNDTFVGCESLTSVTIPHSVTTIEYGAFIFCESIETVNYGGTKAEWDAIEIGEANEGLTNAEIICTDGIINEREPDTSDPTDPDLFVKENEVSTEIEVPTEAADIPESDRITSITINPAFNMKNKNDNNVELDLSKIKIKAEAIYDKEGLKRAEEALGETIKGNKHYNLLDLTLLYNGKDFSNGYEGLVKVIIPLPNGHRDKNFSCFRLTEVDGKMVKEVIPGEQTEDSYIIYLEHFSPYALVADANPDDGEEQPTESKDPTESAPIIPGDTDKNSGSNSDNNSGNDQANTGIALAAAPVVLACAAVIAASKKRK